MMRKYGIEGSSYAVVTGGSNGFGLEFCHQLAAQGFNICMISRNKEKIDQKLAEIKAEYPVEVLGVQADLSKMTTMAAYHELIKEQFPDIDIGILCLNAGVMLPQVPYDLTRDEDVEATFHINGLHVVYLMKALVKRLLQRERRSGVIIVSSGLA